MKSLAVIEELTQKQYFWNYDYTYNGFTYHNFTYNDNTYNT